MDRDLSEFHSPLTGIFADGGGRAEPVISAEQDARFENDGYLAGVRILSDEQTERLRAELDLLMRPEMAGDKRFYEYHLNESSEPGRTLFHALGAWRVSEAFHDLLFHRLLIDAAAALLGGPVRFWHDQLFVKPPHDGGVVAWHQDYSYWTRTKPMAHLTCWIGLDDSTVENGCVHYVPGSHRWPLLPRTDLAGDMEAVFGVLSDEQRAAFKPLAIEMRAGEASFHHSLTMHGSFENRSERPRRAVVINFMRDGVASDSDEPLLDGIGVIPAGEKIGGRYFPLLT